MFHWSTSFATHSIQGQMEVDNQSSETQEGSQKVIRSADKFSTFHMVAFIVAAVVGRDYSGLQPALTQGFAQFLVSQVLIAAAFINFYFCLAEIWSAVPFSGGGYGLTRAVAGFYPGFLVGCADVLVGVSNSAVGASYLSDKICEIAGLNSDLALVFVLLVYVLVVALSIQPSLLVVRRSFVALAVISVGILLIYLFGSLGWTDFNQNASLHKSSTDSFSGNWFSGTLSNFMIWLPIAASPYVGVKSFTLMCAVTDTPKVTLPQAVSIALPIVFGLNMFAVFVMASQPGGILNTSRLSLPMSVGFEKMFNVSADAAYELAAFLMFPAAFAKVYAYMIPNGTLLQSFGRTNLLPSFMMLDHNKDHTRGTIITALLGFLMCVLIKFRPTMDLYSICVMATAFSNIVTTYSYIKLRYSCPTLEKTFTNPLGVVGAVCSILLFVLVFISAGFLQATYEAAIAMAVLFVVLTVYYYSLAVKTQTMSKEEDKVFLLLHVKNFNKNKKKRSPTRVARMNSPSVGRGGLKAESPRGEYARLWDGMRKLKLFGHNAVCPNAAVAGNSISTRAASTGGSISSPAVSPSVLLPSESRKVEPEETFATSEIRGVQLV